MLFFLIHLFVRPHHLDGRNARPPASPWPRVHAPPPPSSQRRPVSAPVHGPTGRVSFRLDIDGMLVRVTPDRAWPPGCASPSMTVLIGPRTPSFTVSRLVVKVLDGIISHGFDAGGDPRVEEGQRNGQQVKSHHPIQLFGFLTRWDDP